ncbi:hypothetical protein THRCLA_03061 [Thraustotheca clavata]|uniref:C2H2-type domain-containing protein n=1 Tax=Thraustotheca clavata TaxID=74557 RepID=A0A1W0A3E5_9STRA|nr:hypothetical protein THRCLA_03061 [Thraustotheca clavata]
MTKNTQLSPIRYPLKKYSTCYARNNEEGFVSALDTILESTVDSRVRLTPLRSRQSRCEQFLTSYCPVQQVALGNLNEDEWVLLLNEDAAGIHDQRHLLNALSISVDVYFIWDRAYTAAQKQVLPYVSLCFSRFIAYNVNTPTWTAPGILSSSDERKFLGKLALLQTNSLSPSYLFDCIHNLVLFRTVCAMVWRHENPKKQDQSKAVAEIALALFDAEHDIVTPQPNMIALSSTTLQTPRCLKQWPATMSPSTSFKQQYKQRRKVYNLLEQTVENSQRWIRDHCSVQALMTAQTQRVPFALRRFERVFLRMKYRLIYKRFDRWRAQVHWERIQFQIQTFFRLKCVQKLCVWARSHVRQKLVHYVQKWQTATSGLREVELLAAQITLQAWFRSLNIQRQVEHFRKQKSAHAIQITWKHWVKSRYVKRELGYLKYKAATSRIERFYICYRFCYRDKVSRIENRSARLITRSIRQVAAKRTTSGYRLERRKRNHAAIKIQRWFRQQVAEYALQIQQTLLRHYSARVLQRLMKWAALTFVIRRRVANRRVLQHKAAVKLQQAYRSKLARAKLWQLRDEIEAYCRCKLLQEMWQRASATSIQQWWRHRKAWWAHTRKSQLFLCKKNSKSGYDRVCLLPLTKQQAIGMNPPSIDELPSDVRKALRVYCIEPHVATDTRSMHALLKNEFIVESLAPTIYVLPRRGQPNAVFLVIGAIMIFLGVAVSLLAAIALDYWYNDMPAACLSLISLGFIALLLVSIISKLVTEITDFSKTRNACIVSSKLSSFNPDILVGHGYGCTIVSQLIADGKWVGPTLLLAPDSTPSSLGKNVYLQTCGSLYQLPHTQLKPIPLMKCLPCLPQVNVFTSHPPKPIYQPEENLDVDTGTFDDLVAYTLDHENDETLSANEAFDKSELDILYTFLSEHEEPVVDISVKDDDGVLTLNLLDDSQLDAMLDSEELEQELNEVKLLPPPGYVEPKETCFELDTEISGKNRRLCKMEGCHKRSRSHGLCIAHGGGRRCAVEGCNKSSQGGNLCIKHGGGKRCEIQGCERAAQSNMLCKAHGGGPRCLFDGCDRSSQGGGYCRSHGGGKRCLFEGCDKGTQRGDFCALHGGSRLCGVAGCMRNDRGGGFCATHGGGKRCSEPGCMKPCRRQGLCSAHFRLHTE